MADTDLTSLDKVRAFLGLDVLDTQSDVFLSDLIVRCSSYAETQTDRRFKQRAYDEWYSGDNTRTLHLRQSPVQSVSLLSIGGTVIEERPGVGESGYVISSDCLRLDGTGYITNFGSFLFQSVAGGPIFTKGVQNIHVIYTAGYVEVPPDVEQAVITHIALSYNERKRIGQSTVSTGIAGETVNYLPYTAAMAGVDRVYDLYRRFTLA